MTTNKREKHLYEELKEQLSDVGRSLKNLETKVSKHSWSFSEGYKDFLKFRKSWRRSESDRDLGLERLERTLETLREIQKQQKTRERSKVDDSTKGKRKRAVKSIQLNKLVDEIENYKSLVSEVSAQIPPIEETLININKHLKDENLQGSKADRTRRELDALNIRWNVLRLSLSNDSRSLEAFVLEVHLQYSQLSLWFDNAESLESLLIEYAELAKKPEKLATTVRAVRNQLHDNQKICEEAGEFRSRFENMSSSADGLTGSGRLDEADAEEVNRTRNELITKWQEVKKELFTQRNRIYDELNKLRKRAQMKRNAVVRRFSSLRSSTRKRRSLRKKQEREAAEKAAQTAGDKKPTVSENIEKSIAPPKAMAYDETDFPNLESDFEQSTEHEATRLESDAFQNFDIHLKSCEKSIHDLEEKSLLNFSAVGSSVEEFNKQLHEIKRFEDDLKISSSEFDSVVEKFEEGKDQDLFAEAEIEGLDKRVEDLKSSWQELWREHKVNKNRIAQALLMFGGQKMEEISTDLDEVEKQTQISDPDKEDLPSLAEKISDQKRLLKQLDSSEVKLNELSDALNDLVKRNVLEEETCAGVLKDIQAMKERLARLRNICTENEERLSEALLSFDQRRATPEAEAIEVAVCVSEDGNFVFYQRNPDDLFPDEGFAEAEVSKMDDFKTKVKFLNQWMDDTETLVNSMHVRMPPDEASKTIQQIKDRCKDLEENEMKVKHVNKIGHEITNESLNMTTRESVESELKLLNKKWSQTKEMLYEYNDEDDDKSSSDLDCCFSRVFKRMFHASSY